jgi:hypothetical protein
LNFRENKILKSKWVQVVGIGFLLFIMLITGIVLSKPTAEKMQATEKQQLVDLALEKAAEDKDIQEEQREQEETNIEEAKKDENKHTVATLTNSVTPVNSIDLGQFIASVKAINGKQVEIKFNKAVNQVSAENVVNYKIAGKDGSNMNIGKVVYLNPTTVIATLDFNYSPPDPYSFGTDIALNNGSSYKLTVSKDLIDDSGKAQTADVAGTFKFTDTTIPTITKVSVTSGRVRIFFNEPIKGQLPDVGMFTLKLLDKNGVPTRSNLLNNSTLLDGGYAKWGDDEHKSIVTGTYMGYTLNDGSRYRLSFMGPLTDYVAHKVPLKTIDVTYIVDKTAPLVIGIKYISQKYVEVTFNKPVLFSYGDFYWNTDGAVDNMVNKAKEVVPINETAFRVGFSNLMSKGNNFILAEGVYDLYQNRMPTTKIPITVTGNNFEAATMYVDHGLNSGNIDGDEYIIITFSNNIDPNTIIQGWNGTNTKNISLTAVDGGAKDSDTLSMGNVGAITFSGNEVIAGGSIIGTVSMPNSNQVKVKLGAGTATAEFSPVLDGTMTYKAGKGLVSVDAVPVNGNLEIIRPSDSFLIAKRIYLDSTRSNNNFSMQDNYGAKLIDANIKINASSDLGVLTAVDSLYKGAAVALTATSVGNTFTNSSVSITRTAGSGEAIATGETLYIRVQDSNITSNIIKIVFKKNISSNEAVTNADFIVTP